jgi:hypothetical protein
LDVDQAGPRRYGPAAAYECSVRLSGTVGA